MSIENIKKLREMTGAGMMDVKKALDASNDNIDLAIDWLRKNGISKAAKKADRIAAEGIIHLEHSHSHILMLEINTETDFVASNHKFKHAVKIIGQILLKSDVDNGDLKQALNLRNKNESIEEILINLTATIGEKISLTRFLLLELNHQKAGMYLHSNERIGVVVIGENISSSILKDVAMHAAAMAPEFLKIADIPQKIKAKELTLAKELLKDTLANKPERIQAGILQGKVNKVLSEQTLLEQTFVKDSTKKVKNLQGKGEIIAFYRYEVGENIEKKTQDFANEVAEQIVLAKK